MKVGFHVGGFAEIKLTDKFAIQPELLYSTQGTKNEESEPNYEYKNKLNLAYLNIPVMFKYYVAEKFNIEAGPQIGFLLSAEADVEETTAGITVSGSEDEKEFFESVDFGVNFGAGYDFTENVSAGIRYNVGLSNISKVSDDSDEYKLNNSVFSLSIAYKF